jgi:uncharacterized protein (TIGR02246 family)
MRTALTIACLLAAPAATAQAPSPAALPDAFVAAWNAHDLNAFERLYTPDAVWVPVAEERTIGRAAILAEFGKIHTGDGWAVRTTIGRKGDAAVRTLRPDVATVFFHMDFLSDGQPVQGLQGAMMLVAARERGGWRIAAGQLTKESAEPLR